MKLNTTELENTLKLFFTLSGIRIVIFDEKYNEVIAYPKNKCQFCSEMASVPYLSNKCRQCDINAFEKCRESDGIYIYKCHMGLTEATLPLKDRNKIIGYMMFGQITDIKDRAKLEEFVKNINLIYDVECTPKELKYRNKNQISAAAQLLEICTNYILLKEMIIPDTHRITGLAKEYISQNLSYDIKISDICRYADTSRTMLYEAFKSDLNIGVAEYIKKMRLEKAYSLLKSGEYNVSKVSQTCGFSDYNYFSRIFKKEYGVSPHKLFNKKI